MAINPKSLQNLNPRTSADGATDLAKISVRVPTPMLRGLDALPGDRSANIRAAIALLLAQEKL